MAVLPSLFTSTLNTTYDPTIGPSGRHIAVGGNLGLPTTWNSADKSANITLSNADATAVNSSGSSNWETVRGVAGKSSGKWYFEVSLDFQQGNFWEAGITNASSITLSSATRPGANAGDTATVAYLNNGNVYKAASIIGSIGAGVNGDILKIAVDISSNLIWMKINNGSWNGSGTANPATGTGGLTILGSTTYYPFFSSFGSTYWQAGLYSFSLANLPSGFSVWI